MASNTLKPHEAMFVLEHVQEGIVGGESQEEIAKREQWLARQFACSRKVIRGVTEHLWDRLHELLESHALSNEDVLYVRECLAAVPYEERSDTLEILADDLGVDVAVIRAITDGVREPLALALNGKDCELCGGEHFDYDNNPEKKKFRSVGKKFVGQRATKKMIDNGLLVCLPGKLCLEIDPYAELGIPPAHMLGIEGGDRLAQVVFDKNAARKGIRAHRGRAEKFLPECPDAFTFASFDLEGQMCDTYIEIFQKLLLEQEAFVLVNVAGKRERAKMQQYLQLLHSSLKTSVRDVLKLKTWEKQVAAVRGFFNAPILEEEGDVISRDELCEVIKSNLGTGRRENQQYPYALPLINHPAARGVAGDMTARMATGLRESGMPDRGALIVSIFAQEFMQHAVRGSAFLEDLEQYSYTSQKNKTPFLTHLMHVHTPRDVYTSAGDTVNFLLQSFEYILRKCEKNEENNSTFVTQTREPLHDLGSVRDDDYLYLTDGTITIASLPLKTFEKDVMVAYQKLRKKDKAYAIFKEIRLTL